MIGLKTVVVFHVLKWDSQILKNSSDKCRQACQLRFAQKFTCHVRFNFEQIGETYPSRDWSQLRSTDPNLAETHDTCIFVSRNGHELLQFSVFFCFAQPAIQPARTQICRLAFLLAGYFLPASFFASRQAACRLAFLVAGRLDIFYFSDF